MPLAPRADAHGDGARRRRPADPGARHAGRQPRDRLARGRRRARRSWRSTRTSSSRASTASGGSRSAQFFTGYRDDARAPPTRSSSRVEFTLPRTGAHQLWRKVGTRAAQSISKVALAAVAEFERGRCVRVGLGMASVAPVTVALPGARARPRPRPRPSRTTSSTPRCAATSRRSTTCARRRRTGRTSRPRS